MQAVYNIEQLSTYMPEVENLLSLSDRKLNNLTPAQWAEQNVFLTKELSSQQGYFSYDQTPYTRELVNLWHSDSQVRKIAIMKAAQTGGTSGAILNGIAWMIANDPSNAMLLVGSHSLIKSTAADLDATIDAAQLRSYIRPNAKRAKNNKSGDTDTMKEYEGGSLILGLSNPDSLRQVSIRYMMVDDYDAMKGKTEKDGDLETIIDQRSNAFANTKKAFLMSTPTIKGESNIETVYEKGDKRKYHIPCPCCKKHIPIEWEVQAEYDSKEMAGITWECREDGTLIESSVGYTCQKCGGFFDDRNKMDLIQAGEWIPTAKAKTPNYRSYHLNALVAPIFMASWQTYVYQYLDAINSEGAKRIAKLKTFYNLVLGLPYEVENTTVSATKLQENIRPYDVGVIPERLSIADGNGKIVLVTCGVDLGGKEDDAKVDYEVVAYAENGQTYSITHGTIGSFIYSDPHPEKRTDKKTYKNGLPNSVWLDLKEVLNTRFENDNTGKQMPITLMGIDTGFMTDYAYNFMKQNKRAIGLKGSDDAEKFSSISNMLKTFKTSDKKNLYLVQSNYTKDLIASHMALEWSQGSKEVQPFGFMNYPTPSNGLYLHKGFFSHYESEKKQIKNHTYRWVKKSKKAQNHFWDCRIYAEVTKDVFLKLVFDSVKLKNGSWEDYVRMFNSK